MEWPGREKERGRAQLRLSVASPERQWEYSREVVALMCVARHVNGTSQRHPAPGEPQEEARRGKEVHLVVDFVAVRRDALGER